MKTQTHTPGFWKSYNYGKDSYGNQISTVACNDGCNRICGLVPFTDSADETIANARLIASAPDLLEALRACLDPLQQAQNKHGDITAAAAFLAARAAIAKAEGKQ